EGIAALERALDQTCPHVVAARPNDTDPAMARVLLDAPFRLDAALRRRLEAIAPRRTVTATAAPGQDGPLSGRPDGAYTATERMLGEVYAEFLGFSPIGLHENFFAIGGNSILAARMVNRLRVLDPALPVAVVDVLRHATIAQLAAELSGRAGKAGVGAIPAVPEAASYPASAEQRRFWMQHQMERDASLFNLTGAYRVGGDLDAGLLDRALTLLVDRHAPLRTVFRLERGELRQVILPAPATVLARRDLSGKTEADAQRLVRAEAARPFDLEHDLPLRAILLDLGAQRVLCLSLHHIAGDGWGLGVFTDELHRILAALKAGTTPELAPLPIAYKDYSVWQQQLLATPEADAQKAAWRRRLAGRLPTLALDTDFPRPHRRRAEGRKVDFWLAESDSAALSALGRAHGASPYMVFLALVGTLLHRLTGQGDIIVGVPTAGRDHPALEGLVGNFLNMLPMRLALAPGDRFEDLLVQARDVAVEAFENQLIPFDAMIEGLDVPRLPGRNPVFDVMLLFQNHREADLAPSGLSPFLQVLEHSKADVTFEVREVGGRFQVAVEYDTALFRPERIAALWDDFQALARSAGNHPGDRLCDLALAPSAEADALADAFNAPLIPDPESTPLARVLAVAERTPDAIAMQANGRSWTYAELVATARDWAACLDGMQGRVVAAAFGNDARQVAALLGAWMAGAAYMPLDPTAPPARRQGLLALTRPAACAVADADAAQAMELPPDMAVVVADPALTPRRLDGSAPVPPAALPAVDPDADSYVFATSGSTGEPKAVLGRHGSLDRFLRWQAEEFDLAAPRLGFLIGFTFDASLRDILLPLTQGGTLVVPAPEDRENLARMAAFIARERLTALHTVPSVLRPLTAELAGLGADPVPALGHVFISGEPLYAEDHRRWRAACGERAELVNFYGSTETTLISCFHRIENDPPAVIPAGRPRAETRLAVVAGGRHCRPGEVGEILIKTPHATKGYVGRPDLTDAVFGQNPLTAAPDRIFRTGDLGRLGADGRLEVLGRADSMVKLAGVRVDLGEIEQALLKLPQVVEAAVTVTPGEPPTVVAHVVRAAGAALPNLRQALAGSLPANMIPSVVLEMAALPRLPSGKVNRAALGGGTPVTAAPVAEIPEATGQHLPNSDMERTIALLWGEVLGQRDMAADAHFMDLGGTSLNAMTLLPRLARAFDVELRFSEFMANATIQGVARLIRDRARKARPRITRLPEAPAHAVSHAQQRMWLLHGMDAARATFNIKRAWDLSGPLDPEALRQALDALVRRHESLRTTFTMADTVLSQRVAPAETSHADFAVQDLSSLENPEAEARQRADRLCSDPFDLEAGPLMRARAMKLAADRWVLALAVHHIVADGWSMTRLEHDLVAVYNALRRDPDRDADSVLPPLAVQYRDFAAWQNALLAGEDLAEHRDYWRQQLAGELPVLDLPLDFPRPALRTSRGAHETCRLSGQLVERLHAVGRARDASLFMVATAALTALLARLSGQDDIIVGTAVAGRDDPDTEPQIGFYVNALALRSQVRPDDDFDTLLTRMRGTTMAAYEHQAYPFDQLVDDLDLRRDLARTPVFDVAIQLLHHDFGGVDASQSPAELAVKRFKISSRTAQFDLTLFLREDADGLFVIAEYNRDLFRPETIARWLGHYRRLLEAVAADPRGMVADVDLLSAEEHAAMAAFEQGPPIALPVRTIHGLFEASAEAHPDLPAVILGERAISYGDMEREANRIAQALRRAGVNWDCVVGLLLDRSPEFFAGLVGILKAGGAFLPMAPKTPVDRLRYMLRDAGARALVTTKAHLGLAGRLQWDCTGLDTVVVLDADAPDLVVEAAGEVMDRELWEDVGARAEDDIQAGGWTSSYTGQPFTRQEMDEYADNAVAKIAPLLTPASRVLEIGCSSGLTLKRVAPLCAHVTGIDLSASILARTGADCAALGLDNVTLARMAAHEIDALADQGPFDVIVINSVIQAFPGHGYLRHVLTKALAMMPDTGWLFLGDIQDLDLRDALVADIDAFRRANPSGGRRAKVDVSNELFLSRAFFDDLVREMPGLAGVSCSTKTGTIANELTRFRFDAVIRLDRAAPAPTSKPVKRRLGRRDLDALAPLRPEPVTRPRDMAYVLYTSGSTGRPKGVMVEHEGVALVGTYLRDIYRLTPGERIGQFFSQVFDGSVYEYVQSFASAATMVVIDDDTRLDAERFLALMHDQRVTVLTAAPAFVREIDPDRLSFLRVLASGGEAPVAAMARQAGHAIVANCYGPTEFSILAVQHFAHPDEADLPNLPIGRPIPGNRATVLDARGHRVPFGVAGELWLSGPGLARGYCNLPEETARRFQPLPVDPTLRAYRTGDQVRLRPDGVMEFRGRNDTQLSIRGIRIEADEVEAALRAVPGVHDVVVMAFGPSPAEAILAAWLAGPDEIPATELSARLAETLPAYMIPAAYVWMDRFPKLISGKIDRRALPAPVMAARDGARMAARDQLEADLAAAMAECLGLADIAIDDDFFEAGGHSLKAMRFVSLVRARHGHDLSLRDVFEAPTVAALAGLLRQRGQGGNDDAIPRQPEAADYPLSHQQRRLWVLDRLDAAESAGVYTNPVTFRLRPDFDVDALEGALNDLTARHESLRTAIVDGPHGPRQSVLEQVTVAVVRRHAADDSELERILAEECARPFDLAQPPLFRAVVVSGAPSGDVLLFDIHHIVSDGWSLDVIARELHALMAARREGRAAALPALPIHYRDFAVWQAGQAERGLEFWTTALGSGSPPLELPTDRPRPAIKTYRGATVRRDLPADLAQALRGFATARGVGLFATLLAAFTVFLRQHSGQDDITVGSPVAGRDHPDLAGQIGFFVNTLALRQRVAATDSFDSLAARVRRDVIAALEHQATPFDLLVERLAPPRDLSREPFFDVLMALHDAEPRDAALDGLGEPLSRETGTAKFDLSFRFVDHGDRLTLAAEYGTDLFEAATIATLIDRFQHLAGDLLAAPARPLLLARLLEDKDAATLCAPARRRSTALPARTLAQLFALSAAAHADAPAVTNGRDTLTYAQLDARAEGLARRLRHHGAGPDVVVGIACPRDLDRIVAVVAVVKAGAAYLPLDADQPAPRVAHMVRDAGARLILTTGAGQSNLPAGVETLAVDGAWDAPADTPLAAAAPDSLAYVIYTSGSTGTPKGVAATQANVCALAWNPDFAPMGRGESVLHFAPFGFDAATFEIWCPLLNGAQVALAPDGDPDLGRLADFVAQQGVSILWLTAGLFAQAMDSHPHLLDGARRLLVGGDRVPPAAVRALLRRRPDLVLVNGYGPTETTTFACTHDISAADAEGTAIPIGLGLADTR
ncbi:MAG TPA: condensation domain-containing protein, partial [Magnetospirillum sp.]|nr:condensation domain-containing protein [Magnetospirillum sp.]